MITAANRKNRQSEHVSRYYPSITRHIWRDLRIWGFIWDL